MLVYILLSHLFLSVFKSFAIMFQTVLLQDGKHTLLQMKLNIFKERFKLIAESVIYENVPFTVCKKK